MTSRNPTLPEVINAAASSALEQVLTWVPAKVVRYDAATQQVDAQPIPKDRYFDEDGAAVVVARPVVPSVPVVFPGGGGLTVTFPIEVGDVVILLFSGVSIDKWLRASHDDPSDPEVHSRHGLADAVAIPCVRNFSRPRESAPTDHVRIGTDGADAQGAALGANLAKYVLGLDGTGTSTTPMCLQAWLAAVTVFINGLSPGTLPGTPVASDPLESSTVKVTE